MTMARYPYYLYHVPVHSFNIELVICQKEYNNTYYVDKKMIYCIDVTCEIFFSSLHWLSDGYSSSNSSWKDWVRSRYAKGLYPRRSHIAASEIWSWFTVIGKIKVVALLEREAEKRPLREQTVFGDKNVLMTGTKDPGVVVSSE